MEVLGLGASAALLAFLVKALADLLLRQNKTISNHIQHSTEILTKLNGTIDRNTDALNRLEGKSDGNND